MQAENEKAIVLLSGGLDSATVLAMAKDRGFACHCMSFSYGQRHTVELDAARKLAEALDAAEHIVADIDLRKWGGSALTDELDVPKDEDPSAEGVPITYVPARNTVFLSFALGWAEVLDASAIFIGANALDYSGYPDCRPEFVAAFQEVVNVGTKAGVEGHGPRVEAPLMKMTKAQIIAEGTRLGLDYGLTISCYDPSPEGLSCGHCDSCQLRKRGFAEAGLPDPTRYV